MKEPAKNQWHEVDATLEEARGPLWYRARHFIAGFLIAALVTGLGVWLYRAKIFIPSTTQNNPDQVVISKTDYEALKVQIEELNKKIAEAQEKATSSTAGKVAGASTSSSSQSSADSDTVTPSSKININTADQATLETLPGIGATYAQRIIEYRNANGGFKSIDELDSVKGIGPATLAKLRDLVTI